ncbi:MAG: hypothetical protein WBG37_07755 [Desulfobacterales bacterium]
MNWINRQRYYLEFILASLGRRKWKNASLVTVYMLVVFFIASVTFFSGALRREADLLLRDAPELIVQRMNAGRHALIPQAYATDIAAIRGVQQVTPRLWGYYFHPASGANYTLMAPEAFAHGDGQVVIGAGVARTWDPGPDRSLVFKASQGGTVTLTIADTFSPQSDLVAADLILMSAAAFRNITGVAPGLATDLALRVRNEREIQTVAGKIVEILPDTRPILRSEIRRTYASVFHWRSGYVIVLLSGSLLAFIIFAWDKATGLSAEERSEIGILKGVGWDTADILMIKFWEGALISLSAFLVGIMLAYGHVFLSSAFLFAHALKGWAVLYPEFQLQPFVNAYHLAVLFALTVIPYTFITIVPAWRAAVTDPEKVMTQG